MLKNIRMSLVSYYNPYFCMWMRLCCDNMLPISNIKVFITGSVLNCEDSSMRLTCYINISVWIVQSFHCNMMGSLQFELFVKIMNWPQSFLLTTGSDLVLTSYCHIKDLDLTIISPAFVVCNSQLHIVSATSSSIDR